MAGIRTIKNLKQQNQKHTKKIPCNTVENKLIWNVQKHCNRNLLKENNLLQVQAPEWQLPTSEAW